MKKLFHLTESGINQLKKELKALISGRPEIAERINQARQLGDLSENHEYQAARTEQDRLESRIAELEHVVNNSEVIKKPRAGKLVQLGSTVKLKGDSGTKEFAIVGTVEADPMNGKVSDESPIGKALLDKELGDTVEIKNGNSSVSYKITGIS